MSTPSKTSSPATLSESKQRSGKRVTLVGMAVNVFLIALKIAGGILGSSAAMIADAFHSLSDFITDIGVLIGLNFLAKPPDSTHAYGHARIETAISFLMGLTLLITGLGILKSSGQTVLLFFDGIYPPLSQIDLLLFFGKTLSIECGH